MAAEWFIGVDPGLKTGLALVSRTGDEAHVLDSLEVPPEEVAPVVRKWITAAKFGDTKLTVVCESYVITMATSKKTQQGWSLENIGIVKQCMRDAGMNMDTQLVMQMPAVKVVMDNPKLQRTQLWHRGGAGHANDALRHIGVRMINVGWRDPRLLASS